MQIENMLQSIFDKDIDITIQEKIDNIVFELYGITEEEKSYINKLMLKNT